MNSFINAFYLIRITHLFSQNNSFIYIKTTHFLNQIFNTGVRRYKNENDKNMKSASLNG